MTIKSGESRTVVLAQNHKKIVIWFCLAAFVMAAFAVVSYKYVSEARADMDRFVNESAALTGLYYQFTADIRERDQLVEKIGRERDHDKQKKYLDKYNNISSKITNNLDRLAAVLDSEKEQSLVTGLQEFLFQTSSLYQAVIFKANENEYIQATNLYLNTITIREKIDKNLELLMFVDRSNKHEVMGGIHSQLEKLLFYSTFIYLVSFFIILFIGHKVLHFSALQNIKLGVALTGLDVSYKELDVAQRKVEEANKIRMEFIANMSHELRTPMTSIKGALGILNSGMIEGVPEDAKKMCQIADDNADRLLILISDMLDFSKIAAGDLKLVYDLFNIEDELVKSTKSYEQRAIDKNLMFNLNFDDSLPKKIRSDRYCISQIIGQLLSNAIKFTNEGKIEVDVTYLDNQEMLKVSVIDTGVGLSEEAIPQMFEYFVQGDGSSTRKFGGTGMGLAICKQLTAALGGNIGAENNVTDCGSTFWFTVPTVNDPQKTA